ncbi:hypothetical protein ASE26_29170 [Duganella sp. Root198D2]|nr:hypothetical protein ASE26_29170 [Duganella sp. Root198D2]
MSSAVSDFASDAKFRVRDALSPDMLGAKEAMASQRELERFRFNLAADNAANGWIDNGLVCVYRPTGVAYAVDKLPGWENSFETVQAKSLNEGMQVMATEYVVAKGLAGLAQAGSKYINLSARSDLTLLQQEMRFALDADLPYRASFDGLSPSLTQTTPPVRPVPRIDVSDEFVFKPQKNGSAFLSYGNPETHGLEVFIDKGGVLGFDIRSAKGGTSWSNASGTDMFASAMIRLEQEKVTVNAIRGTWVEGTDSVNTAQYLHNLKTMSAQDAARNTWTGQMAAKYGYTKVGEPKTWLGTTTVIFTK